MNKNVPSAIKLVRSLLDSDGDVAKNIVFALDKARLLVDLERSYGVLLRRTPDGSGWTSKPATEAERQGLAWEASCRRANELAARIDAECAQSTGLQAIRVHGDQLLISIHITDPRQWGAWRAYLGITSEEPQPLEYAYCGSGHRDGVGVQVVAYDAPEVEARAVKAAHTPYRHGGVVYDLALPQQDGQGDLWDFRGFASDGTAMLAMRGVESAEPAPLWRIVEYVGPLTGLREDKPLPGIRQANCAPASLGGVANA